MKYNSSRRTLFTIGLLVFAAVANARNEYRRPRLAVIVVVDALSYKSLQKVEPFLDGGMQILLEDGIVYTDANCPYGTPSTGPGHTSLNTGTFAKDHGIVGNSWLLPDGHKVRMDDDNSLDAAVFSPDGLYDYGKSAHYIMADGISDVMMLRSDPCAACKVFSFSHKSRAAIAMANKLGKAFWFDTKSGLITSSKAYFDKLPDWLVCFNERSGISSLKSLCWKLCHPYKCVYNFKCADNYEYSKFGKSIMCKQIPIDHSSDEPFRLFPLFPQSCKLLFDAAETCIKANISCNRDDMMLVWISLSSLDKVSHYCGPQSKEAIDIIYHIDRQLKRFMRRLSRVLKRSETLFVLTADHGFTPIPELVQEAGYKPAHRIIASEFAKYLTNAVKEKCAINMTVNIKDYNVHFSEAFEKLSPAEKEKVLRTLKEAALRYPGIKNVWTNKELDEGNFAEDSVENFLKQQRFPGRNGQLYINVYPYCDLTKHPKGASHEACSEWNIHVPIIIYRKDYFARKMVNQRVWMTQFAPSLSQMLCMPKPSASFFKPLPGIFAKEETFL